MKTTPRLVAAVAIGLLAWSVPTYVSANVRADTVGGYTEEYDGWQGLAVFDTNCDNNDVYSDFKRDIGTSQVWRNSQGCNTLESTGISGNLISRFNHCTDDAGPNTCSVTRYR